MENEAKIKTVDKGSLGAKMGIKPGDILVSINGEPIIDILDYRFLECEQKLRVVVKTPAGEEKLLVADNPNFLNLGLSFENELIQPERSCLNKCVFCFIDQLPKGMRESVYFKDDDMRLSFMLGNYVTLTNLSESDIDRMIRRKISPINISVHTTNPELRVKMLSNKNAGKVFSIMQRFAKGGMTMNAQIVLVPGFNDGAELDRTIGDLFTLYPYVHSVCVVPVGLTRHREGLCPLTPFTAETAGQAISQIEGWQRAALQKFGTRLVYAADEFYVKSKTPVPGEEAYEDFPQIENGVGMIASLLGEFYDALEALPKTIANRRVSIITGVAAKGVMGEVAGALMDKYKNLTVSVRPVVNNFFGPEVTVAGLLCGCDIVDQLKKGDLGDEALIPVSMLKHGTDLLLDDYTVGRLEAELGVPVRATNCDGYDLAEKLIGIA